MHSGKTNQQSINRKENLSGAGCGFLSSFLVLKFNYLDMESLTLVDDDDFVG